MPQTQRALEYTLSILLPTTYTGVAAYRMIRHADGAEVAAIISGGESNIDFGLRHQFRTGADGKPLGEWDRSVQTFRHELKAREWNRVTADWPFAGCHPDELARYTRESFAAIDAARLAQV